MEIPSSIKVSYTSTHVTVRSVFGGTLPVAVRPKVTPTSDSSPPNFLGFDLPAEKKKFSVVLVLLQVRILVEIFKPFFSTYLFPSSQFSAAQFHESWNLIQSSIWLDRYPKGPLQRASRLIPISESCSTKATQTQTTRERQLEALASR